MTKRTHRRLVRGVYAPRSGFKLVASEQDYGRHLLDSQKIELHPDYQREGTADDRYLSPSRSEAVRALLIQIAAAQGHGPWVEMTLEGDFDLQMVCADAQLTERQTEVVSMTAAGWRVAAIAQVLEVSHSTVLQHLRYGRRKLAGHLQPVDAYGLAKKLADTYNIATETTMSGGS